MRVFGAAAVFRPVAALLFSLWIAASPAPALAIIPGRDAPVTVEQTCNPKPDAADIPMPLPCDLELALREVKLPGGGAYLIGKYELSRYQWDAVMEGKCEALSTGPGALPLREVTPSAIRDFLRRYNDWLARERRARPAAFSRRARDAGEARLPAEAEWEFAARGGLAVPEAERMRDIPPEKLKEFGVISDPIPIHEPERIGSRLPNPLGLYDTVGNVKEMVAAASDSLIAFRGASFKHNPGEVDIGRHDEITAINERGAERTVSDLGLRLAFSTPGYKSALAARALHPEAAGADEANGDEAAEESVTSAAGGLNLPLALALCAVAFAAGGIITGLVVWFYQRRRLGMPVEDELVLQENLTKWQRGYKQVRAALNKTLKEAAKREEAGLAAEQRASDTQSALAQTLQAAAASEEARRAAEARAEAAEQHAEKATAYNKRIIRAAEEQIRRARAELEELRKRAEESEQARQTAEERASAAENHAEKTTAAFQDEQKSAEATQKQAEQAEAALAQARTELATLRKAAETAEAGRVAAEERVNLTSAQAEEAAKQARTAEEQARVAVAELEQVRHLAEERDAMRLRSEEKARQAAEQARLAAEQAKEAVEEARRAKMVLERQIAATRQGRQPSEVSRPPQPTPQPGENPVLGSPVGKRSGGKIESKTYTNSVGMEFIKIPAGTFLMGSDADDSEAFSDEKSWHGVLISRPFFLGKYPVTQAQWQEVMGNNPSHFKEGERPVENVSWNDVQEFIRQLNLKEGHDRYRLPTEAEWEYACRAGTTSRYCYGDSIINLGDYAWYEANSENESHPVGQKLPNDWGLYDMHGNVWEWCADRFGSYCFYRDSVRDPQGPEGGVFRVLRGGCWSNRARFCRSAFRRGGAPEGRSRNNGFRLALGVE